MRRTFVSLFLVGGSLGMFAGCSTAEPQTNAQGCQRVYGDCTKVIPCEVAVELRPDGKKECHVTRLSPADPRKLSMDRHRIKVCAGDPVTWTFDNQCGQPVTAEVTNFRIDEQLIKERGEFARHECRDVNPFSDASSVKVAVGEKKRMPRKVAPQHYPRTYKYDIVVIDSQGKRTVLDPEAEIYR